MPHLIGEAQTFAWGDNPLQIRMETCEAELILGPDGQPYLFYNGTNIGGMPNSVLMTRLTDDIIAGKEAVRGSSLPLSTGGCVGKCRFPGVFNSGRGGYYLNGGTTDGAGHVHLWRSPDLFTWTIWNGSAPVMHQPSGWNIWNVSILPVGDVWYALIEATNAAGTLGLYTATMAAPDFYSTATTTFDATISATPVIPGGGNAHLKLSPCGTYIIAYHGIFQDTRYDGAWYTTISTVPIASFATASAWKTYKDAFSIGQVDFAICDPSILDGPTGALMVVSYGQTQIRMLRRSTPFAVMHRGLLGR